MTRDDLPVHFLTIVLNGEPFLRYHIDVFRRLPFRWHWHVVEGLATLTHDTAWSVGRGGRIAADCHRNGRSIDGTTEYLDGLQAANPDRVSIYRKPDGVPWDGKTEMVNAPLASIHEECLLWQVDADELWTAEQVATARQLFLQAPEKTAAYYWCWYFVGERLLVSTRSCYSQNPRAEWLRTWRFRPGMRWSSHEPPRLVAPGAAVHLGAVNPFRHAETEAAGLMFQHFAYVTREQLEFKERYYGYAGAVEGWSRLQRQTEFPQHLGQYFPWVKDHTEVDRAARLGVVPLAQKTAGGWRFDAASELGLAAQAAQVARLTQQLDRLRQAEAELQALRRTVFWTFFRGWTWLKCLVRPATRLVRSLLPGVRALTHRCVGTIQAATACSMRSSRAAPRSQRPCGVQHRPGTSGSSTASRSWRRRSTR